MQGGLQEGKYRRIKELISPTIPSKNPILSPLSNQLDDLPRKRLIRFMQIILNGRIIQFQAGFKKPQSSATRSSSRSCPCAIRTTCCVWGAVHFCGHGVIGWERVFSGVLLRAHNLLRVSHCEGSAAGRCSLRIRLGHNVT